MSRIFDVQKGGATIGLDNLMTGENMLRSVRAEAMIEVNGIELPVGGLIGQPIHNYLLPEWLEAMQADPKALKLQCFYWSETEARMSWKKRPEWMPKDLPWPEPGKKLTFEYQEYAALVQSLMSGTVSDLSRKELL
ncbi:hypothetical protein [Algoriphagus aquimarinus]|uniref:hypothetical protein n=1 Tax=Algoriphagus aquimarinus TaxID=237018 RepID=UPI001FEB999B|nr:hypothetical protein [Algoriphagus aquimarinus]